MWRIVYRTLFGKQDRKRKLTDIPEAFCDCKRKRQSLQWRTTWAVAHLMHFKSEQLMFVVKMAEVFYPFSLGKAIKWLQSRVGSISNMINVCATHGAPNVAIGCLLPMYQSRFHCLPSVTPGAFLYAIAHGQSEFLDAWQREVSVLPADGLEDMGVKKNTNHKNLRVAICMGISIASQSMLEAKNKEEEEEVSQLEVRTTQLVSTLMVCTPVNEDIQQVGELLEIASFTGASPLIETILALPQGAQFLHDEATHALKASAFCSAAAGGHTEVFQLLLNAVPRTSTYSLTNFSTSVLTSACTTEKSFGRTCKAILRIVAADPSRWDKAQIPEEFLTRKWAPFVKSTVASAASRAGMWGTVKKILCPEFSETDEGIQSNLPVLLHNIARRNADDVATPIFEEILVRWRKRNTAPLPKDTLYGLLNAACTRNNDAVFNLLVAQPEISADINRALSELLVSALSPNVLHHFHKLSEDLIGIPKDVIASIAMKEGSISHYLVPPKTFKVADALLPFIREQAKGNPQTGDPGFKMNVVLWELVRKGCSGDAFLWLDQNNLLTWDMIQYPVIFFQALLKLRPVPKKGGSDCFTIGYRKLNKHILGLQGVITPVANSLLSLPGLDLEMALLKAQNVWPVTLYLLSTIDSGDDDDYYLADTIAEYVDNFLTVQMLSDAVFVDLSLSGKYFSMDEVTTGLPSLFDWLVEICSYETIVPKLYEFFHDGGGAVLAKHPDRAGVKDFQRKAACLLGRISRDLGSPGYGVPHLQGATLVFPGVVSCPAQRKPKRRYHVAPRKRNHSNAPETGVILPPSQRGGGGGGAPSSASVSTPTTLTRDKDGFLIPPLPSVFPKNQQSSKEPPPAALCSNTGTNKSGGENDDDDLVTETHDVAPTGPSPKVQRLNNP
ncbi:hypothetical protein Pelo_5093 [Pelomyxa schiedti]|nr:hypothetical protein Pelo_5093 [Pelomyxa schiedti]